MRSTDRNDGKRVSVASFMFACSLIFLLPLSGVVEAQPVKKKSVTQEDYRTVTADIQFTRFLQNGKRRKLTRALSFQCLEPEGVPGKVNTKKGLFLSWNTLLKRLRRKIRQQYSSIKSAPVKERTKVARLRSLSRASSVCEAARIDNEPPADDASAPIASDGQATAVGIEQLAISLPVQVNLEGATVACEIVAIPDEVIIEMTQGCNVLVTPRDHRIPAVSFQFIATRDVDGVQSNTATFTVSWDQSGDFVGDPFSMSKYKESLTDAEAMYLIRWAGLGIDAENLRQLATGPNGLEQVVDRLLTPQTSAACRSVDQEALDASSQYRFPRSIRVDNINFYEADRDLWSTDAASQYMLYHLRHSCDPLRERMALLWHNHFAVSFGLASRNAERAHWIKLHVDYLRGNVPAANGSLFTPLDDLVAFMHGADGIMLNYLNNDRNAYNVSGGNENYARELLELFTLGVRDPVTQAINYTEEDIYAMRFALMGYSDDLSSNRISLGQSDPACCNASCTSSQCQACAALSEEDQCRFFTVYHRYPRFFRNRWNALNQPAPTYLFASMPFGQFDVFKANTLGMDGDALLPSVGDGHPIFGDAAEDNLTPYLMYQHPGVARYFASRLVGTFASLELTDSLVQPVADALIGNNYDPTEALRLILTSSAFFGTGKQADQVSNPPVRLMSFARLLELPMSRFSGDDILRQGRELSNEMGFRVGGLPSVFGVEEAGKIVGGDIKSGVTFGYMSAALGSQKQWTDILNETDDVIDRNVTDFTWESLLPKVEEGRPTPEAVVDHFAHKLGISLNQTQRELFVEYLTTLSTASVVEEGLSVPDPEHRYTIDWQEQTLRFDQFWELKAPGLIQLFWSLPQTTLR